MVEQKLSDVLKRQSERWMGTGWDDSFKAWADRAATLEQSLADAEQRATLAEARLAALEACGLLVYMREDKVWQSDNCVAATLTEIADGEINALRIVDKHLASMADPLQAHNADALRAGQEGETK